MPQHRPTIAHAEPAHLTARHRARRHPRQARRVATLDPRPAARRGALDRSVTAAPDGPA